MNEKDAIRVIVFTGGAELQPDVLDFVARLESQAGVELVAIFCQTTGSGFGRIVEDLWNRRGLLTLPLLLQRWIRIGAGTLLTPGRAAARRRTARTIANRLILSPDLHGRHSVDRVKELAVDLGLVYGGPILQPQLYSLPRLGTLGIHHGLTPKYRGKKTTFWAIFNGEESVGVTIQLIGKGLDRGDIVKEGRINVGHAPLPIVMARLRRLGLDLYMEAIFQYRHGAINPKPQVPGSEAIYADPNLTDVMRFWWLYFLRLLKRGRSV